MIFAHPQILWLLFVLLPALAVFFWWSWRTRQKLMTQFIQSRLLGGLVAGLSPRRQKLRLAFLALAVACFIIALARPQWGFTWQEVKQRGVDVVVAIDTSKSMLAQDIAPNRLTRAKLAAVDLMRLAQSDRLGLVAFAGNAFLQCPLTIDDAAFRQSVDALDVNTIPQGGTALAEAIETARTAFKEGENYKVLVLMTDGEDHDSGALEAAEKAAQAGMRIYTLGIGTAEGELLRAKDAQGREDYIRDEQGNVVKSHLNEQLLKEIAGKSEGGFYLPLRGTKAIETLYSEGLAKLPKSEHQDRLVKQYQDRYHWPLAVGIILLIAEMLLPERKREPQRAAPRVPASAGPALAAALFLLLNLHNLALGSPSSALREYKAGKYDQALKEYEKLLEGKTDDPRLHFNAGTAAYGSQKFDEAVKQFNEAVGAPDLKLQELAYYNRGNALYRLGETIPDPKQRTETWQKALKDYELSLKLDPKDADAKFNHEFVKKRLEELKQQQQQQQKQDKSDQNQNQDQQQQQQQNQSQDQKDQNKQQQDQQQQSQSQQDQKKDSAQQKQKEEQQQKEQQQQQQAPQSQEQKEQQAARQAEKAKEDAEEKERQAAYAAGQMTPEQAQQLLDAQKAEEKMLPSKPENKQLDHTRPFKDW